MTNISCVLKRLQNATFCYYWLDSMKITVTPAAMQIMCGFHGCPTQAFVWIQLNNIDHYINAEPVLGIKMGVMC